IRAFVLLYQRQYEDALAEVERALAKTPAEIWFHDIKALCLRGVGRETEALAEFAWLWDQFKEPDRDNYLAFGWAALNQRKTDEALGLFEGLCQDPVRRNSSTFTFVGLALLASGKIAGAESNLTEAVNLATNRRDIQL